MKENEIIKNFAIPIILNLPCQSSLNNFLSIEEVPITRVYLVSWLFLVMLMVALEPKWWWKQLTDLKLDRVWE